MASRVAGASGSVGNTRLLRANAYLQMDTSQGLTQAGMFPKLRLADGVKWEDIHFGELGYAREARASYQDFLDGRSRQRRSARRSAFPGLPADADGGDRPVLLEARRAGDRAGL